MEPMKLSVIVPAYNEEKLIGGCLASIQEAFRANAGADWAGEIVVVDNNSTDGTAALAREAGARVVFEPINQISRARNAGAAAATGDWLLFVDADSYLAPATLVDLLATIRQGGIAGGGCLVGLDVAPPVWELFIDFWNFLSRTLHWAAGSFVFCRAEAFREIGGFTLDLYAAEEIRFSGELKRWAKNQGQRVVILQRSRHISSGRKFQLYNRGEILRHILCGVLLPWWTLRDRAKLGYFYDGRR
jgi:glycosyltransferase involved in cell wall biosynthesis